jgi:prophage antirepressor-like protein
VGKDVASAFGYKNTKDALMRHIDEEDKLTSRIDMAGQNRQVIIINKSGLYALILSSKLESAKDSSDGSPAKSFWRRFNELLM